MKLFLREPYVSRRFEEPGTPAHSLRMPTELFTIKSLLVQNGLMLGALGITILFLIHAIWKKRRRHIIAFSIWPCLVVGFFNSSLFGFSEVEVGPEGLKINYGLLSLHNSVLPLHSDWRIQKHRAGLRKTKRLYSLVIAGKESMRVRGGGGLKLLDAIGRSIDRMKAAYPRAERFTLNLLPVSCDRAEKSVFGACAVQQTTVFNRGGDFWSPSFALFCRPTGNCS